MVNDSLLLMSVAAALAALPLDGVTPESVTELFTTGALTDGDEAVVSTDALSAAADALRRAVAGQDGAGADGRAVPAQLADAEIEPRAAVVVLYRLMGERCAARDEQLQSVAAASCYVLLMRCIGEAFQPLVFRRALNALRGRRGGASAGAGTKRKAAAARAAPAKRGAAAGAPQDDAEPGEEEGGEEEEAAAGGALTDELTRRRVAAAEDVATLVSPGPFSLSGHNDSLLNLVEVMVDLIGDSVGSELSGASPPFRVLRSILSQQHGPPADTMKLVFQALLPILLCSAKRGSGSSIPKAAIACRNAAAGFVSELMSGECKDHPVNLVALCQHMCMKVSERAEYRRSTCQTAVKLLLLAPDEQLSQFTRFLTKYSKNEKALYRHFSCDVSLELVTQMRDVTLNTSAAFTILKGRAADKAPTVRAKALVQLSACLMGPRSGDLLGNGTAVDSLLSVARARSRDAKPMVRKAGVQLLCAVLQCCVSGAAEDGTCGQPGSEMEAVDPADIQIIADRCRDSALTTRKAALQMLTDLLVAAPASTTIQATWLKTVLPCVLDQQASAVDSCCAMTFDVLLAPLVATASATNELAWSLLERIRGPELLQYLHKIMTLLRGMPKFSSKIGDAHVKAAHVRISQHAEAVGPWVLLEEVSHLGVASMDAERAWQAWETACGRLPGLPEDDPAQCIAIHALRIFANCQLHGRRALSAAEALVAVVRGCAHTPQVTKAALDGVDSMAKMATDSDKAAASRMLEWGTALMTDCDALLYDYMFGAQAEAETDPAVHQRLVMTLFITGEIAMLCAKAVPKRSISVLQSLVNPADNAEAGKGVRVAVPENVRAHAVVALGKICLDDQSLAKKCVAAFARELQDNKADAPVIRNNIIFILSDLCRRFTSLVDPHLSLLSRCLADPLPLVRKQTMLLLAGLLQEDYLKWKGPLFYRFLVMTVDPDLEIAAQARFILFTLFHKVDDKLLSSHFVESLFYLNDFNEHESYNQFSQSESDRALFCLPGKDLQDKRMKIYTAMLEPLPDEQKLHVTARLCHDVLARATDTDKASAILDLDNERATQVLHDAMVILASSNIKLSSSARKSGGDVDEDIEPVQPSTAAAFTSAATAKVLSQVAKKGSVEQTLPILAEVRRLLMERKSPLLRSLMIAVRETIKDYQEDIKHILTDRQLAAEIMYDLEQMKLEAEREARRSAQSPRGIASSPRSSNTSARASGRLSMTPAKPTSLKDTFTPALSIRRGSASSEQGGRTPFSVPRLRGRASASPAVSARKSAEAGEPTFAVPKPKTPAMASAAAGRASGAMPPPSPIPSSLPLRIYNKQPPNEAVAASAEKAKNVDILMPSPVQPLPEPRVSWL